MTTVGAKFTSRLKFPDLGLADAGKYKVMVENLEFSDWKSDMTLTVYGEWNKNCKDSLRIQFNSNSITEIMYQVLF